MFTNIGAKIKGLAKVGCWVGIVGCIFAGVVLLFTEEEFIPIALGVAVGGGLASWIGSWFLYGFGQLIENSDVIAAHYQKINTSEEQRQQQQVKKDRQASQKRKQAEQNRQKQEAKKALQSQEVETEETVPLTCPHCGTPVDYTKSELEGSQKLECPFCYTTFSPKDLLD